MSEQAAQPKIRKYVIAELHTYEADELWSIRGRVEATSRAHAFDAFASQNEQWEGGTLVAIPEGSWVPTPVRVETKREVTLG